jgi:hypothetical protein
VTAFGKLLLDAEKGKKAVVLYDVEYVHCKEALMAEMSQYSGLVWSELVSAYNPNQQP